MCLKVDCFPTKMDTLRHFFGGLFNVEDTTGSDAERSQNSSMLIQKIILYNCQDSSVFYANIWSKAETEQGGNKTRFHEPDFTTSPIEKLNSSPHQTHPHLREKKTNPRLSSPASLPGALRMGGFSAAPGATSTGFFASDRRGKCQQIAAFADGNSLQGMNISHLGKRQIIFKMPFLGDMLVPWMVMVQMVQKSRLGTCW